MSQEELALAVGASVRAVGDWENDRRKPRNRTGALEEVLGISLNEEVADRSPPRRLSEATKALMRDELGAEEANALIAHHEHLVSGRTPPAEGQAPRPAGSGGRGQQTA